MQKKIVAIIILLAVTILYAACSNKNEPQHNSPSSDPRETDNESGQLFDDTSAPFSSGGQIYLMPVASRPFERKLIWSSNVSICSNDFKDDLEKISKIIDSSDGWIESDIISGLPYTEPGGDGRVWHATARVPWENFSQTIRNLSDVGVTVGSNIESLDVTLQYGDTETRKKAVETQLDRLIELSAKAETIEDVLLIETEISRLITELETLSRTLLAWDNAVDYSTISIVLREEKSSAFNYTSPFSDRLISSFNTGLDTFIYFVQGIVIFFAAIAPFVIFIAIVTAIAVMAIRKKALIKKSTSIFSMHSSEAQPHYESENTGKSHQHDTYNSQKARNSAESSTPLEPENNITSNYTAHSQDTAEINDTDNEE